MAFFALFLSEKNFALVSTKHLSWYTQKSVSAEDENLPISRVQAVIDTAQTGKYEAKTG
jgi:hypothetical protein